jgi:hypothetical protein
VRGIETHPQTGQQKLYIRTVSVKLIVDCGCRRFIATRSRRISQSLLSGPGSSRHIPGGTARRQPVSRLAVEAAYRDRVEVWDIDLEGHSVVDSRD